MNKRRINKIFLSLIFLSLLSYNVFAQKRKPQNDPTYDFESIHFGFTIGLNVMDFGFNRKMFDHPTLDHLDNLYPDVTKYTPGFHVGIISEARIDDYFSLRVLPTVTFGARKLVYYDQFNSVSDFYDTSSDQWSIESTYVEIPILIKYKSRRLNNHMPYLIGGINAKFDMAAQIRKNDEGQYPPMVILKPFDLAYEVGFGVLWYLPYFKFGTEFKLSLGLRDVMMPNPRHFVEADTQEGKELVTSAYTECLDKLTSNIFMISFHFE